MNMINNAEAARPRQFLFGWDIKIIDCFFDGHCIAYIAIPSV
jgi:hypothetical protein